VAALRLGIVGLGWWGQRLAAAAQSRPAAFEIARYFSPDRAEREDFAQRFDARPCDSLDALLVSDIDAVILATPHSLHARQIEAAARDGNRRGRRRGGARQCRSPGGHAHLGGTSRRLHRAALSRRVSLDDVLSAIGDEKLARHRA
jgi:hypothetical protein